MDVPGDEFNIPRALRRTEVAPGRVLIVGSCMSEQLPHHFRLVGWDSDLVPFNNVGELPARPPSPLDHYQFQAVQLPVRTVLPEAAYFRAIESAAAHETVFAEAELRLLHLLDAAMGWNRTSGLLTFAFNFLAPQQNALGRMLSCHDARNMARLFQRLNGSLDEAVTRYANAFVVDCDAISASHGRRYVQDDVYIQQNHAAPIADDGREHDLDRLQPPSRLDTLYPNRRDAFMASVIDEMLAMHRTALGVDAVKLVIVDLDDTLWRGMVVEHWRGSGHAIEGYPLGLAEALLYLKARGIVLAIVSKNDPDRIAAVWGHVWQGRLSLDDFAARQINWRPKEENVGAVIAAVNVRPDSVVFIDDNPVERARVQASFPDIRVLGGEPFVLRRILLGSPETQVRAISEESSRRTSMIQAQIERDGARGRLSRDEFLATLEVRVTATEITSVDDPRFGRCLELINKTNQFNTTGRRLAFESCQQILAAGGRFHAFEVRDRYVDYGLAAVAVTNGDVIEQFVMSCRVIGLDVEYGMIATTAATIRAAGHETVAAELTDSGANILCHALFQRSGFSEQDGRWVQSVTAELERL